VKPFLLLLLLPALAAPSSRAYRLSRVEVLEETRSPGAGELERYLGDRDAGVRRRAALAAGRLADPAFLPNLVNMMNDAVPEVRQMAAWALGRIRDTGALPRLLAALEDPDAVVRARAAQAVGRIGDRSAAPDVARMVLRALPRGARQVAVRGDDPGSPLDPWLELRLGLFALADLGDVATAESVFFIDGAPRFDWWAAACAAAELKAEALRPVYLAAIRSSDPLSRLFGARGLGALEDPTAADSLSKLLSDRDENVAATAVRAMVGDGRSVNAALSALGSTALGVKQEALGLLARMPLDRNQRDLVVSYVGNADPALRAAALRVVAGGDPEQLALLLAGSDPDPEWFVRAELVRRLGDVGSELALGLSFGALRDPDARVVAAALETIARLRGSDARDVLVKYVRHADPAVRATAVRELLALDGGSDPAGLIDDYLAAAGREDPAPRLALVAALRALDGESAGRALQTMAEKDPAPVVRAAASGQRPMAWRRPRTEADYRVLVGPYAPLAGLPLYTPRVFLRTSRGVLEFHLNVVEAPLACEAFIALVRRGYFSGLTFDTVTPGIAVTGGSPRGDGWGGPGFVLPAEIGTRPFGRGALVLVPTGGVPDTAGSRFAITLAPAPELEERATLVGWLADGFDALLEIRPGDVIERTDVWDGRE